MVRQARIVIPGIPHHVTQRGNNHQDVFFVDSDRREYLSYLKQSAVRYGAKVSAYCLMTNHVHLIVTPENTDSLSKVLGRTHLMYAQYIHELHGRWGHFWQNRFYSCPLDEAHMYNAAAYIELNPVRAGMVKAPWEYAWSSAGVHCGIRTDSSGLLDVNGWFEQMPVKEWQATLEAIAGSNAVAEGLRAHTRTGRPLGNDAFLNKIETVLGQRVSALPRGRPKGSKDKTKRPPRKK